jgi:hypothetical protein
MAAFATIQQPQPIQEMLPPPLDNFVKPESSSRGSKHLFTRQLSSTPKEATTFAESLYKFAR